MVQVNRITKTQSNTFHGKNFNGYSKPFNGHNAGFNGYTSNFDGYYPQKTENSNAIFFGQNPNGVSKLRKIILKSLFRANVEENSNHTRIMFHKLNGKLKYINKQNDITYQDKIVRYHDNGKTVKSRETYGKAPNGKIDIIKEIKYDESGKEISRYYLKENGEFLSNKRLENGNISVEMGVVDKRLKITESINYYINNKGMSISKVLGIRGTNKWTKKTAGISIQIKAKELEKLKETHQKAVDKFGQEKAGIIIAENPYYESFLEELSKIPHAEWSAKNFSKKIGTEMPHPPGRNPDEILNVYILKSPQLIKEYEEIFSNKRNLKAIESNKKSILDDFWTTTANRWDKIRDSFDEKVLGKLHDAESDVDFKYQADYVGKCAVNDQYSDIFQELLYDYNIRNVELHQSRTKIKRAEPKEGKKLGWRLP